MKDKKGGWRPAPTGFVNIPRTPGITWPEAKPDKEQDPTEEQAGEPNRKPVQ